MLHIVAVSAINLVTGTPDASLDMSSALADVANFITQNGAVFAGLTGLAILVRWARKLPRSFGRS